MADLIERLAAFPLQTANTRSGTVSYRTAGSSASTLVLLHGIGSASGSWLHQLEGLAAQHTVLAWDAPGYGQSTHLSMAQPLAIDYAKRVWDWLDALPQDTSAVTLVGHSLGALMVSAAASLQAQRVKRLVLLAPAAGYGQASEEMRRNKLQSRLQLLQELGPKGMAEQRAFAMLSPQADAQQLALVQHLMAAVDPQGYTQAAHMLAGDDIAQHLRTLQAQAAVPLVVGCGSADTITPAAGCADLARHFAAPFADLGPAGHACALQAHEAVNRLLKATP